MSLSIYTYLFRATVAKFDLDATIANFTSFADEVVIATLADQEDDTLDRLLRYEDALDGKLKIEVVSMDITKNNRFDGDLKTAALQRCTHPIRIIADCDERFVVSQRPLWDSLATQLITTHPNQDGYLIPVVDLYRDRDYIRMTENLGVKFRMHKATVTRRGVPRFAERGSGLFDTSQSDSTEPLLANGELGRFIGVTPTHLLHPSTCHMLNGVYPYVLHEGFLDLQRRADLGRTFWKQHWEARSGHPERVETNMATLQEAPIIQHKLVLV